MREIKITDVNLSMPDRESVRTILSDINLTVQAGEFVCLAGPSGCGKTTLMNVMAGFLKQDSGSVRIDGEEVKGPDPRHIVIFQDYALFPWLSVHGNVRFGLEAKGFSRKEAGSKALKYLELVGLAGHAGKHPHQLSGGMKQRVAIARALAVEPDILFMDEPFAALDTFTRFKLQDEVLRIWKEKKQTIVFVTHDLDEAVYLANKIVLMSPNPGRIKKIMDIKLQYPFDRSNSLFLSYRKAVYREFEIIHQEQQEFSI